MIELYPKIFVIKGLCNSYYIDDKVKVLIDAGNDFKNPVDLLILTHIHPDHTFFAAKIQARTKCKIMIGKGDENLAALFSHFSRWQGKKIEEFKIDKALNQHDKINTGQYCFETLELAGHTLGSIGLYEKTHEILFCGDTIFENGFVGRTDLFYSSEKLMQKTLKKLKKLSIKHLFSGHNY
ncbi:MAG: MBL fold metallo-hydrolase [Candidatus Nanoarchaeia archaeon]|jgi:glyoxylase-like metal-dependent hydrolase (beta-lactamase superfamily II)